MVAVHELATAANESLLPRPFTDIEVAESLGKPKSDDLVDLAKRMASWAESVGYPKIKWTADKLGRSVPTIGRWLSQ